MTYSLLIGNYGCRNFGDDLLLLASQQNLPGNLRIMAPGKDFWPLPPAGFRSLFRLEAYKAIYRIYKAKRLYFGGGGLFSSLEPHSFLIWGQILFWALIFRKKVTLLGQSLNAPLPFYLRFLFDKSRVFVRDSQSLSFYPKAKLAADLVFALDLSDLEFSRPILQDYVCVSLRDFPHNHVAALPNICRYLSENYVQKGIKVVFLPFKDVDAKIISAYDFTLAEQVEIFAYIKYANKVYCGRLHCLILAALFEKPLLCLAYAPKMRSMAADFGISCIDLAQEFKLKDLESADVVTQKKLSSQKALVAINFQ